MHSLEQLRLGIVTRGRACPQSRACQEGPAAQHRALCMCPEHKSPLQHPAPQCRRSGDKPQPARGISSGVRNRFRGISLALQSGWMATKVQPHMFRAQIPHARCIRPALQRRGGGDSPQPGASYRAFGTGSLEGALHLGCMDGPAVPHNTAPRTSSGHEPPRKTRPAPPMHAQH